MLHSGDGRAVIQFDCTTEHPTRGTREHHTRTHEQVWLFAAAALADQDVDVVLLRDRSGVALAAPV